MGRVLQQFYRNLSLRYGHWRFNVMFFAIRFICHQVLVCLANWLETFGNLFECDWTRGLMMLWMHVDATTCLGLPEKAPEKLEVVERPTTLKATRRPETERSEGNVSDSDLAGHSRNSSRCFLHSFPFILSSIENLGVFFSRCLPLKRTLSLFCPCRCAVVLASNRMKVCL